MFQGREPYNGCIMDKPAVIITIEGDFINLCFGYLNGYVADSHIFIVRNIEGCHFGI